MLFSMNTEASADLHRSGSRSTIGWQIRRGRGRPAWAGLLRGVHSGVPPSPRPRPLSARARGSASCKWRALRQMRSSGSGGGSGSGSWYLPLLLSRGSQGSETPSGRPLAS